MDHNLEIWEQKRREPTKQDTVSYGGICLCGWESYIYPHRLMVKIAYGQHVRNQYGLRTAGIGAKDL